MREMALIIPLHWWRKGDTEKWRYLSTVRQFPNSGLEPVSPLLILVLKCLWARKFWRASKHCTCNRGNKVVWEQIQDRGKWRWAGPAFLLHHWDLKLAPWVFKMHESMHWFFCLSHFELGFLYLGSIQVPVRRALVWRRTWRWLP